MTSSIEESNIGSCFCFTFPYRQHIPIAGNQQVDMSTSSVAKRRARAENMQVDGTVLVAEDDVVSRRLVKRMLELSGCDVILAEDGEQAVEAFKTRDDIALILMDVQMPNMDGLAATKLIRTLEAEDPRRKPVPIIALSAGAMKGDHERGLAVGMTYYLTKPVDFKLLQKTLRTHIGTCDAPRPPSK